MCESRDEEENSRAKDGEREGNKGNYRGKRGNKEEINRKDGGVESMTRGVEKRRGRRRKDIAKGGEKTR